MGVFYARLPDSLLDSIRERAKADERTITETVRQLIERGMRAERDETNADASSH